MSREATGCLKGVGEGFSWCDAGNVDCEEESERVELEEKNDKLIRLYPE